jgi:DNA-binding transcriptional LysR family regulator
VDLRLIRYFVEVAKTGSFTKAGDRLHISQSSLSKAIQELEKEWETRLFDRSTRRIRLTETGQMFLMQSEKVLQAMEQMRAVMGDVTQLRVGHVRMGLPPVIGSSFFPAMMAQFSQRYPGITIAMTERGSKEIERLVLEGSLDLGVVVLPVEADSFHAIQLIDRTLYLIVHPRHRLAHVAQVQLRDLAGENFLLFQRGFALYDRVCAACVQAGFQPRVMLESSQWDYLSESAAEGLGVTFLPETVCAKLDPHRVAIIRELSPAIPWRIGLIWSKQHLMSHAEQAWLDFVMQWFRVKA